MAEQAQESGSSLMKAVEAIAITPQDAREMVEQYREQVLKAKPKATDAQVLERVTDKIISRYCKLAATSGAATAIPGAIPGVGTAVGMLGGSAVDIPVCIKLQIDMTMCLGIAINGKMSNEDAKHMAFIIALYGSLEQMGSAGATRMASKAGVRMVQQYLTGSTLTIIKEFFKKIGITFTQKAAAKAIPFGVGIIVGGTANYALTRYVGNTARDTFLMHLEMEDEGPADTAQA
ncbi:EcsC family protein [Pseudomonas sichuanensis]|uniref:EcsC family protein n=1 Tax=Pseudomonas TaxID=286 RepID=UPI00129B6A50|nr:MULTISPECIES: EcsC family protein [Pseudomonas]MDH0732556.1 EcsC family protein [Pseudomonas sichuanensis]MDH1582761.1 EcsC family protein [Pseudomonas sichuanensis]MDH1592637.1 EcsC family protein [Pseudomonas sichuanensis]MDH1598105.1 EcsC family protein [Pseudomonas sichuanensis]MDU9404933.1 EcsC family protein [Pseudomonas sp. zfem004]